MSLNKASLQTAFESLLTFDPTVPTTYTGDYIAEKWADAIDSYSAGATDELGNSLAGGRNKAALLSGLKAAFNQYSLSVLSDIGNAISAYWASVTFAAIIVPPDGQPGSGITNIVSNTGNGFSPDTSLKTTTSAGASELANTIDSRTKQVKTTISYLSPPPSSAPLIKILSIT